MRTKRNKIKKLFWTAQKTYEDICIEMIILIYEAKAVCLSFIGVELVLSWIR